ncbi:MAG: hypothetical protein AB1568_11100 [Thermodesulfobacteriota bacterium]
MNKTMTLALLLALPSLGQAQQVYLDPGQSYEKDGLAVYCGPRDHPTPVILTECQHWDDFHQKCLFEEKRHLLGDLECRERCQHWDSFAGSCRYRTTCRYEQNQHVFVETVCESFDSFAQTCVKSVEKLISSPSGPQRR